MNSCRRADGSMDKLIKELEVISEKEIPLSSTVLLQHYRDLQNCASTWAVADINELDKKLETMAALALEKRVQLITQIDKQERLIKSIANTVLIFVIVSTGFIFVLENHFGKLAAFGAFFLPVLASVVGLVTKFKTERKLSLINEELLGQMRLMRQDLAHEGT